MSLDSKVKHMRNVTSINSNQMRVSVKHRLLTSAALLMLPGLAQGAPIDLTGAGLSLTSPSYSSTGGAAFFVPVPSPSLLSDFVFPPGLTGFAGSQVSFLYSSSVASTFSISYTGFDNDFYDVTEIGFTDESLQFLIERPASNPTSGNAGDQAFVEITSAGFDFAGLSDPFDFFSSAPVSDFAIDLTIDGLTNSPSPAPIPLPAGLVLLGTALLGFYGMRRSA
jgi:hypothetical protein